MGQQKPHILIGSSVCKPPRILAKFLESMAKLETTHEALDFYFIDDNQTPESSALLQAFRHETAGVTVAAAPLRDEQYVTSEFSHNWTHSLIARVSMLKNLLIDQAKEGGYDYLFLIDADTLIAPGLLHHLVGVGKEIVSEINWAAWRPNTRPMPNCWLFDNYEMAPTNVSKTQRETMQEAFLSQLQKPGLYEVGGLAACTLVSAAAIRKGASFTRIKNVSFWGEDRWFCVRAAALGIDLFIDTHYPGIHLYREADLDALESGSKSRDSAEKF
ncbi:MAG: glycosyltransferase family 2 protein [Oscillospiraceae bacterium]|jgi:hypothetical protein|nr:glycosyltransferase family 2 protein [Oscillospiraceae bacterium]